MNAESRSARAGPNFRKRLQWGRVRMNAERQRRMAEVDRGLFASMGPRSDERGKALGAMAASVRVVALQWGRVRMNAERRRRRPRRPAGLAASMGPRSDERGKSLTSIRLHFTPDGFNGAAFG